MSAHSTETPSLGQPSNRSWRRLHGNSCLFWPGSVAELISALDVARVSCTSMNQFQRTIAALFAFAVCATAQTPQPNPKPPVGLPSDAILFNGKWYFVYMDPVQWKRANEKCVALRGQLAVVPDEATHAFIKQLSKGLALWLGATDEKVEGLWTWVDGSEMKFKAWADREPAGRQRENYLFIRKGRWEDVSNETPIVIGYICEWKAR